MPTYSNLDKNLVTTWRRLTVRLSRSASASIATLVVVVAVEDTDVLSTVALALAILSFAGQLASNVP